MASNIDVTQGSGKTVATDEVSSAQYQKIKVVDGRTGSVTAMTVNPDGSINASIIGTVNIAGSVIAVVTSNPNQSVSGAVTVAGSVMLGSSNASIIALVQGSVATAPILNQSVSGAVTVAGSVMLGSSNASVIAIVSGSIAAVPAGNQSVSGALNVSGSVMLGSSNASVITVSQGSVGANILNTNLNVSGSVATFPQGTIITSVVSTVPSSVLVGASIFGQLPAGNAILGAVAASISGIVTTAQSGTVVTSLVSTVPSSVIVGASIFGLAPVNVTNTNLNVGGSVVAFQGTAPWATTNVGSIITVSQGSVIVLVQGSVATVGTAVANQSISGAINVSGSVMLGSSSASVITLIQGSVAVAVTPAENQSVSGTVGASVIGWVPIQASNTSIIGVIQGSVAVAKVADANSAQASILVGVTANTNGSVLTTTGYQAAVIQITSGPGASITAALNFEGTLDGTRFVPLQGYNIGNGTISSMATVESNWAFNVTGLQGIRARVSNWSVGSITARAVASPEDARPFAVLAAGNQSVSGSVGITGNPSISGTVNIAGNPSISGAVFVSGSVLAQQTGTVITSVVSSTPSSMLAGASIFGQLPAGTAPLGSVAALQGTNPWQVNLTGNGSVLVIATGSTIGYWDKSPSVVGTYAEDAAHATGDKGFFVMQVRNDTMASMTSADGDYSPIAGGPVGETIVANAPITKWVRGTASMLGGTPLTGGSVAIIAAQGSSIFTYITGLQIVNYGATTQFLRLDGATSSIIGFAIAPGGGGSNVVFPNALKTNANAAFTASISGSGSGASVYLSAQGFISKV